MAYPPGRFDGPADDGETALHCAARAGEVEAMKILLADGRFNRPYDDGTTAMHKAAAEPGCVKALQLLLEHGGFNAPDKCGWTALHEAAGEGNDEAIQVLLEHGGFNAPHVRGGTALHVAAASGTSDSMRLLLEHGGFNTIDSMGQTALHKAVASDMRHIVQQLIFHFPYPAAAFGNNYLAIANEENGDETIDPEIAQLIREWRRPFWNPRIAHLYPSHLHNALWNWLLVAHEIGFIRDFRNMIASRIVSDYNVDPEGWNPYNQRNTRLRIERANAQIEAAREEAESNRQQLWQGLMTVNAQGEVARVPETREEIQQNLAWRLPWVYPGMLVGLLATHLANSATKR